MKLINNIDGVLSNICKSTKTLAQKKFSYCNEKEMQFKELPGCISNIENNVNSGNNKTLTISIRKPELQAYLEWFQMLADPRQLLPEYVPFYDESSLNTLGL